MVERHEGAPTLSHLLFTHRRRSPPQIRIILGAAVAIVKDKGH
jgi:hypothetical protein